MPEHPALQPDIDDGFANEVGQTRVRFGICCFMAIYFYATDYSTHPLYVGFAIYCLSYLAILGRARSFSPARTVLGVMLDNFFTVSGLHVTGQTGLFLFIFLIHISFGYGIRYGRTYLWLSVTAACSGVVVLYLASPPWRGNLHATLAFFLGVPFIALYIDYFVQRLRDAQRDAANRAADVANLLTFVAHDIRTPLQSLLSTIDITRKASQESDTRLRLGRMEDAVRVLARLATEALTSSPAALTPLTPPVVVTMPWLHRLLNIFRDEFARQHISLRSNFDFTMPPVIIFDQLAAERLLLNVLSNAAHHTVDGELAIAVKARASELQNELEFIITNNGKTPSSNGHSELRGAGLGLTSARATAASAHGEFDFRQERDGSYVSCFALPIREAERSHTPPLLRPVVFVTPPLALPDPALRSLGGISRIFHCQSLATLLAHADDLSDKLSAIFIAQELLDDHADLQSTCTDIGRLEPYSVLSRSGQAITASGAFNTLTPDAPANAFLNTAYAQLAVREDRLRISALMAPHSGLLSGQRVLVIEDNSSNSDVLAEGLREANCVLVVAPSLAAAREHLATDIFDAVLLDWHLGDGSGVDLIDELASLSQRRGTRVIILSSESSQSIQAMLNGRLQCPILQRPVRFDTIVDAVAPADRAAVSDTLIAVANPADIFDASIYEQMISNGTGYDRIDELLLRSCNEITLLIESLEQLFQASTEQLRRKLHDLKSIADTAGAYELAIEAQSFSEMLANNPLTLRDAATTRIYRLKALWNLTQQHIVVFQILRTEKIEIP